MTASSHDVLTYVQKLESAGFSHDQAVAIAGGWGELMDKRLDMLVTRAHFDAEMASINSRLQVVDQRFDAMHQRFDTVDRRLTMLERGMEKLEGVPGDLKLHTWMLALITLVLVVPKLQEWFAP